MPGLSGHHRVEASPRRIPGLERRHLDREPARLASSAIRASTSTPSTLAPAWRNSRVEIPVPHPTSRTVRSRTGGEELGRPWRWGSPDGPGRNASRRARTTHPTRPAHPAFRLTPASLAAHRSEEASDVGSPFDIPPYRGIVRVIGGIVPKINVYLSDDLAAAVREAGISVSPVCQQALAEAVRAVRASREASSAIRARGFDPGQQPDISSARRPAHDAAPPSRHPPGARARRASRRRRDRRPARRGPRRTRQPGRRRARSPSTSTWRRSVTRRGARSEGSPGARATARFRVGRDKDHANETAAWGEHDERGRCGTR